MDSVISSNFCRHTVYVIVTANCRTSVVGCRLPDLAHQNFWRGAPYDTHLFGCYARAFTDDGGGEIWRRTAKEWSFMLKVAQLVV